MGLLHHEGYVEYTAENGERVHKNIANFNRGCSAWEMNKQLIEWAEENCPDGYELTNHKTTEFRTGESLAIKHAIRHGEYIGEAPKVLEILRAFFTLQDCLQKSCSPQSSDNTDDLLAIGSLGAIESFLWRAASEGTFEKYCQDRRGLSKPRVYQFIDSAKCCDELKKSPIGDFLPTNESQYRELARLPEERVAKVRGMACAKARAAIVFAPPPSDY